MHTLSRKKHQLWGKEETKIWGLILEKKPLHVVRGELLYLKDQVHPSHDKENDIPLIQFLSRRLWSRLCVISCQPIAMIPPEEQESPISDPSVKAPVRVTRSV